MIKYLFWFVIIIIHTLAFLPNYDHLPDFVSFSDLLNHTLAFTMLFILFNLSYKIKKTKIFIFLLLDAVFIELIQNYLPTRSAAFSDILADAAGLVMGILFTYTHIYNKVHNFLYKKVSTS